MSIKRLDSTSVSKICVNQVVVDLPMCIKELVENGLDAGATKIDITFYEYGSAGVRVSDNGSGISVENFSAFTQKGATSKIGDFDDISKILTYGFRGEALNAISRLSEMKITTKTVNDDNGWELAFDNDFKLVTQKDVTKAEVGTDIYLQNLFRNLPVRYQEFKTHYKTQFTNAVTLLENYALIFTGVCISVINSTADKPWDVILSNNGPHADLKGNMLAVLGKKVMDTLGEIKHEDSYFKMEGFATKTLTSGSMKSPYKKDMLYFFVNKRPVNLGKKFTLLLSQTYKQHNPNAKYLVLLNLTLPPEEYDINISPDKKEIIFKKPNTIYGVFKTFFEGYLEDQKACSKTLDETTFQKKLNFSFKKSESIASTELRRSQTSTSQEESERETRTKKRKADDEEIYGEVDNNLKKVKQNDEPSVTQVSSNNSYQKISSQPSSVLTRMNNRERDLEDDIEPLEESKAMSNIYMKYKTKQQPARQASYSSQQAPVTHPEPSRSSIVDGYKVTSFQPKKAEQDMEEETEKVFPKSQDNAPSFKITELKFSSFSLPKIELSSQESPVKSPINKKKPAQIERIVVEPVKEEVSGKHEDDHSEGCCSHEESDRGHKSTGKMSEEPPKDFLASISRIKINDFSVNNSTKAQSMHSQSDKSSVDKNLEPESNRSGKNSNDKENKEILDLAAIQNSNNNIEIVQQGDDFLESLIQNVSRSFRKTEFKSLFLIGQFNLGFIVCILPGTNEIYVIDQHAAEEKYNFEKLMREHKIVSQSLVCPLPIQLSQTHKLLLQENLDIVEKNGFKVKNFSGLDGVQVMKITALPMIKDTTFVPDNLVDLLNVIEANPFEKDEARIPKIKNVLAMRACKLSVRIGDPLNMSEMKKVVHNLSLLKSPWNCPHGRPTLITLGDMQNKIAHIEKPRPARPFNLKKL